LGGIVNPSPTRPTNANISTRSVNSSNAVTAAAWDVICLGVAP
jgi:hypothetical protein